MLPDSLLSYWLFAFVFSLTLAMDFDIISLEEDLINKQKY